MGITGQKIYQIEGIDIYFPGEAYESQIKIMKTIIKCIGSNEKKTALIESPTGSGKSLAILCSSIGWLENYKNLQKKEASKKSQKIKYDEIEQNKKDKIKLYITSRTHKQITQLINELEKTIYRPKMSILASRRNLCMISDVRNDPDPGRTCTVYKKKKKCTYNYSQGCGNHSDLKSLWTLEDLKNLGKENNLCPYYSAISLSQNAEVIFCPYNYLFNLEITNAMDLNLNNSIIIVDEGHNIEDVIRSSNTHTVSYNDLEKWYKSYEGDDKYIIQLPKSIVEDLDIIFNGIKAILELIEKFVKEKKKNSGFSRDNIILKQYGESIAQTLELNGLGKKKVSKILSGFLGYKNKLLSLSSTEKNVPKKIKLPDPDTKEVLTSENLKYLNQKWGNLCELENFFIMLKKIVSDLKLAREYGISISSGSFYGGSLNYNLSLICLYPGVAFKPILEIAKSIIICSGTLTPLDSFSTELGTKFDNILLIDNVFRSERICATIIGSGKNGKDIIGTYGEMGIDYISEIGFSIFQIAEITPHGVLCFFPSYTTMMKIVDFMEDKLLITQLSKYKKVFIERKPNSPYLSQDIWLEYGNTIQKSVEYSKSTGKYHYGAILFAVFRGQISEGMDFRDELARTIITVGIPFPAINDPNVMLKKEYNNHNAHRGFLSGNHWYEIQAFRAINQAVGRGIRHPNDWCSIIMLDSRLNKPYARKKISRWLEKIVKNPLSTKKALNNLKTFFQKFNPIIDLNNDEFIHDNQTTPNFINDDRNLPFLDLSKSLNLRQSFKSPLKKKPIEQKKAQNNHLNHEKNLNFLNEICWGDALGSEISEKTLLDKMEPQ